MADGHFPRREEEPLFSAIHVGDVSRVRALATRPGTNLMLPSKPGWLAIHQAAWSGQDTCLRVLLSGRQKPKHTHTHTDLTVQKKQVLCRLVSAQPGMINKRTERGESALLVAVSKDHLRCVEVLLENGADPNIPNYDRETPLYKGKTDRR